MSRKLPPRADENLRRALAQEAARVMAEHGVHDFLFAKRKAAERFGVVDGSALPRNTEIEAALAEYQRLFGGEEHVESLLAQRLVAIEAMRYLKDFQPRLVGPVLNGTATEHSDVQLHVFADTAENVAFRLMDSGVSYEIGEKRVKMNAERQLQQPSVHFEIDAQPVVAVVFPVDGIRQAPVSPVDGKPMRRADLAEVEALVAGA
ncbi:MAG: hypothetical protein H7A18_00965 [Sinobacteraceae bacterium]|nr:hypothetical protein [Nevskiaceae bacterium]MCP5470637.1 hypothetical protein [Nevskiaceae bacterium]